MSDENNKDYILNHFDHGVKNTSDSKDAQKAETDYGDGFDAQTGEDNEKHNPDEYYVGRVVRRNRKKEKKRKIKNAVIIACIAIVCILVVFAFALTKCSMPKIELSTTTAPTLPTITRETTAPNEDVNDNPTEEAVQTEALTEEVSETIVEETTQAVTKTESEDVEATTEVATQVPVTEYVEEEVTELPDPEIEEFGQDQDY